MPVSTPNISFVVPLFNHLAETRAMLASLRASLPEGLAYEIILVDDGSSDGTRAWLAQLAEPELRTYLNPHNLGFARSCNAGVALARGALIGLLNNDLLFEPGWLEPMLTVLKAPNLRAGLVGNLQFRVADGGLDHAGVRLSLQGKFEHIQALPPLGCDVVEMPVVTGACILLRKSDFDAVGGFDERYMNGGEDFDLCFKLREAGRRVYVASGSRIRHHVSLSRQQVSGRDERNSQLLFSRWRKDIKRELARRWAVRLQGQGDLQEGVAFVNTLCPVFVARPQTAGLVIAEALLCQQERRWARLFGREQEGGGSCGTFRGLGLQYDTALKRFVLTESAQLIVDELACAADFYVAGRTLPTESEQRLRLNIEINGLQRVLVPLRSGACFNVGLLEPLMLKGVENVFSLRVELLDEASSICGDGRDRVIVERISLDGREVKF